MLQALEIFVNEDEEAEMKRYTEMCQEVVDALIEVPGISVSVEHDQYDYLTPNTIMKFADDRMGPGRDEVFAAMVNGDPPVYLHNIHHPNELGVDPANLDEAELQLVIRRLREALLK